MPKIKVTAHTTVIKSSDADAPTNFADKHQTECGEEMLRTRKGWLRIPLPEMVE